MDKAEVAQRVRKVISEVLSVSPDQIKDSDAFTTDLGAASIQSMELVAGFEEEFDIEMDDDEALSVQTVGAAVDFIAKILSKA